MILKFILHYRIQFYHNFIVHFVGNVINGGGYDSRENQPLSARNLAPQSTLGNLINGGGYDSRENQQLSARNPAPQSALGNVLNGGDDGQQAVVRGRRQAPGGNSSLVLG